MCVVARVASSSCAMWVEEAEEDRITQDGRTVLKYPPCETLVQNTGIVWFRFLRLPPLSALEWFLLRTISTAFFQHGFCFTRSVHCENFLLSSMSGFLNVFHFSWSVCMLVSVFLLVFLRGNVNVVNKNHSLINCVQLCMPSTKCYGPGTLPDPHKPPSVVHLPADQTTLGPHNNYRK